MFIEIFKSPLPFFQRYREGAINTISPSLPQGPPPLWLPPPCPTFVACSQHSTLATSLTAQNPANPTLAAAAAAAPTPPSTLTAPAAPTPPLALTTSITQAQNLSCHPGQDRRTAESSLLSPCEKKLCAEIARLHTQLDLTNIQLKKDPADNCVYSNVLFLENRIRGLQIELGKAMVKSRKK